MHNRQCNVAVGHRPFRPIPWPPILRIAVNRLCMCGCAKWRAGQRAVRTPRYHCSMQLSFFSFRKQFMNKHWPRYPGPETYNVGTAMNSTTRATIVKWQLERGRISNRLQSRMSRLGRVPYAGVATATATLTLIGATSRHSDHMHAWSSMWPTQRRSDEQL